MVGKALLWGGEESENISLLQRVKIWMDELRGWVVIGSQG